MEVDKDTGGVRHTKAENYLPKKIPDAESRENNQGRRRSIIGANTLSVTSWLALLDDFYPIELHRR